MLNMMSYRTGTCQIYV